MKSLVLLILLLIVFSCKKAENRPCWKSNGAIITRIIPLNLVRTLNVTEHIQLTLVQDTANFLEIITGENLINFIEWSQEGNILSLKNTNKCSFLRKRIIPKVRFHFTDIYEIFGNISDSLLNDGTIQLDSLVVNLRDGSSTAKLSLQTVFFKGELPHGFADFYLSGSTQDFQMTVHSNSFCDMRNLNCTGTGFIDIDGAAQLKLKAPNNLLYGQIKGTKDVFCIGQPSVNSVLQYDGKGKLIFE